MNLKILFDRFSNLKSQFKKIVRIHFVLDLLNAIGVSALRIHKNFN